MNIDKFYYRCWNRQAETALIEHARRGFHTLGIETIGYDGDAGLQRITDLGPTVGVVGYIQDVHAALRLLGRPLPVNIDYPKELHSFLGRTIQETTLGAVRETTTPIFIKPMEHKVFTGFVWDGSAVARRRVVTLHDDTRVFASTLVDFLSEYRSVIVGSDILDVRRYRGDWSKAPDRSVVEAAVAAMKDPPAAYCLDWGVTDQGTLLVEMNDGFAFGHYGLDEVKYAEALAARWAELAER